MRLRTFTIGVLVTLGASVATPLTPAMATPDVTSSLKAHEATMAFSFQIRNKNSSLCLTARAGSGERPVVQTTCDYHVGEYWPDQYWEQVDVGGNSNYRIRNTHLGLCLAARGAAESAAVATTCGNGTEWPDQIWHLEYVARWNADRYQNTSTTNCLAARGSGESRVIATSCNHNYPDQHWW